MIAIKSSENHTWPWSDSGSNAEEVFERSYPSVYQHLAPFKTAAIKRQDKGRFWWELRSCGYWDAFDKEKITYQEIQFHSWYGFSPANTCGNNKTFILPSADLWLLAVLNSPLMWWFTWRYLPHMKDEAMSPVAFLMEELPIAEPDKPQRSQAEAAGRRLIEITKQRQASTRTVTDWLKVEMELEKLSLKLQQPLELDADAFAAEVKKARGKKKPLTAAGLQALRAEHTTSIVPSRSLSGEMMKLERRLSDLVNAAYGLTPDEIKLMWETAPPRMPIAGNLAT